MEKQGEKRKRAKNYTEDEKSKLLEIINEFELIIENKKTDKVTVSKKKRAWLAVAQSYNSTASTGVRTIAQLQALFDEMKRKARRNLSNVEEIRTGGGTFITKTTPPDVPVVAMNPTRFRSLENPFDFHEHMIKSEFNGDGPDEEMCEESIPSTIEAVTEKKLLQTPKQTSTVRPAATANTNPVSVVPKPKMISFIAKKSRLEVEALQIIKQKEKVLLESAQTDLETKRILKQKAEIELENVQLENDIKLLQKKSYK